MVVLLEDDSFIRSFFFLEVTFFVDLGNFSVSVSVVVVLVDIISSIRSFFHHEKCKINSLNRQIFDNETRLFIF